MTGAELDIIVGANVDEAIAAFKRLGYTIKKTEETGTKFTEKGKTNFTGLNRVIQDLPFGFIAISNNLEQLLPAAGALGLAFSAVVSVISFLQIGFRNWTGRTKEATEATDEFAKSLKQAESGALATGFKLQEFVTIARDNTKSLAERNLALTEANKLMGEHGQKLTLVNINTAAVTEEINKYTQALIAQAVANKLADRAADLVIKQRDASEAYGKALKENKIALDAATRSQEQFSNSQNPTGASLGNIFTLIKSKTATTDLVKATSDYKDTTQELHKIQKDANDATAEAIKLFAGLGTKVKETKDKIKKDFHFFTFDPTVADVDVKKTVTKVASVFDKVMGDEGGMKVVPQITIVPPPDDVIKKQAADMAAIITDTFQDALFQIGENIGNVISGKGNIFSGIFELLGSGLQQLGKYVIGASQLLSTISEALNDALLGYGGLGIAVGVGLIALGAVLKNIPKFATGGVVTSPTLALVGEQGPERITPLGYEGRANNMMQGEVFFNISGQNLRGILRRADQTAYNTF